jgi:hypothetical protein
VSRILAEAGRKALTAKKPRVTACGVTNLGENLFWYTLLTVLIIIQSILKRSKINSL